MNEKEEWIINYLKQKQFLSFVDILDADFVNEFIEKFDANFQYTRLGAPKCRELSKLLGLMYKKGLLIRYPHGVRSGYNQDCVEYIAPKWVYSYELPK